MGKLAEIFKKRLQAELSERGAKTALHRATGIDRASIDEYLSGSRLPSLDRIEEIAQGLEKDPIDLLFPGELPQSPKPTPLEALEILRETVELAAQVQSRFGLDILARLAALDDDEVRDVLQVLRANENAERDVQSELAQTQKKEGKKS